MSDNNQTTKPSHKRFIFISILLFLGLFSASILIPYQLTKARSISSLQPEILSLRESISSDSINNRRITVLLDSLELKLKRDSISKPEIKAVIDNLKLTFKDFHNSKNLKLVNIIGEKADKYSINNTISTLDWFKTIFSWPVLVFFIIIALLYLNISVKGWNIKNLFGSNLKSLSILGNGIEYGEEVKVSTELSIRQYRSNIQGALGFQIQREQLDEKLRNLADDIRSYLATKKNKNASEIKFRCTIHTQDLLFHDTLYQLLNYYPKSNGGIGRIKSIRFGIIGLAWRTVKSKIRGNVDNNPDVLIKDWGMDISEATSDSQTKSFAAIVIKSKEDTRLGIFYIDAKEKNLFGDLIEPKLEQEAKDFEAFVIGGISKSGILESLLEMKKNLSEKFLQIRIYE